MDKTEHFLFLLIEEFSHMAFSCAIEPLRIANLLSGKELYKWSFASENGETATCSNGSVMLVHHGLKSLPVHDRLFVTSGIHVTNHITPSLLSVIRHERSRGTAIGSLCSGAYVLARAGLLDNTRAAVHWAYHDGFAEEFPSVNLQRSVFVADEKIVTASGGTATADLMLHLIEKEHGIDLSMGIADQMVYNTVREASAEQRVSLQSRYGMRNPHLIKAIQLMTDSIEDPMSSASIAQQVGISTRQLERLFERYLNCSPNKFFVDMRLQKARNLLLQTEQSVTQIACACGFGSSSHFSRVFKAHFGITPVTQRTRIT